MDFNITINELIDSKKEVAIFGSGRLGKSVYGILKRKNIKVTRFVVSHLNDKNQEYDGIPIVERSSIDEINAYHFLICVEDRKVQTDIMDWILLAGGKSFSAFNKTEIDEIYANLYGDINNENELMTFLVNEKKVIVFSFGVFGEVVTSRLISKGIKVEYICVYDAENEGKNEYGIPVLSFNSVANELNGKVVVLAIENYEHQKMLITRLRNKGVEKTILIKKSIFAEVYINFLKDKVMVNNNYQVVSGYKHLENYHVAILTNYKDKEIRWRIPFRDRLYYTKEIEKLFSGDGFSKKFSDQYGICDYIECKEENLQDLEISNLQMEIFMAKFYLDNKIHEARMPKWLIPIQAGAAMTDKEVAVIKDNTGLNISQRNRDYS